MKRVLNILLSAVGVFLANSGQAVETSKCGYNVQTVLHRIDVNKHQTNKGEEHQASFELKDGTRWKFVGTLGKQFDFKASYLQSWQKGDEITLCHTGPLSSISSQENRNIFILKNKKHISPVVTCVVLDSSSTKSFPKIVAKKMVNKVEELSLSDGSKWKVTRVSTVMFWSKPLSNEWKLGDRIIISSDFYNEAVQHLTNVDSKGSLKTTPAVCIQCSKCSKPSKEEKPAKPVTKAKSKPKKNVKKGAKKK